MRTRTLNSLLTPQPLSEEASYLYCDPSWVPTGSKIYPPKVGVLKIFNDVVTPGFHSRRKTGEVFFNPASSYRYEHSTTGTGPVYRVVSTHDCAGLPVQTTLRYNESLASFFHAVVRSTSSDNTILVVDPTDHEAVSDMAIEASTKCLNNRGRPDSNLYETLAESSKALSLLPSLFKECQGVLNKIPSGKLKAASSAWLLVRYGLKPLVNDVFNVMAAMDQITMLFRQTARSKIEDTFRSITTKNRVGGSQTNVLQLTDVSMVSVRAMSLDEFIISQAYESGLSFKNIATLPWELVPLSFVADWFANIGDYLGAVMPAPGFRQLGSCLVIRKTVSSKCDIISSTANSGYQLLVPPFGHSTVTEETMQRTMLRSPGLVWKSDFKFTNLTRSADAAALIAQRLRFRK